MSERNNSGLISDEELTKVSGGAYIDNECVGCGDCISECPVDAIYMGSDGMAHINSNCVDCGACSYICPLGLIII